MEVANIVPGFEAEIFRSFLQNGGDCLEAGESTEFVRRRIFQRPCMRFFFDVSVFRMSRNYWVLMVGRVSITYNGNTSTSTSFLSAIPAAFGFWCTEKVSMT